MEYVLMAIAFLIAAALPYIFKNKKQVQTGIPQVDERVRQRFLKIILNIFAAYIGLGVMALTIFTFVGKRELPLNYIWLYLLLLFLSLSIGAAFSKK